MGIDLNHHVPTPWSPDDLGLGKATGLAALIVTMLISLSWCFVRYPPPAPVPPAQIMQIHVLASVPQTASKPLAEAPPVTRPPLPDTSPPIVHPSVHAPSRPAKIVPHEPVQPRAVVHQPSEPRVKSASLPMHEPNQPPPPAVPAVLAPSEAAADTASGIGPYRRAFHDAVDQNVDITDQMQALESQGTTIIEAVIRPDGYVVSASILSSSGNGLVDQAALKSVLATRLPFRKFMPTTPITVEIPVEITAGANGD